MTKSFIFALLATVAIANADRTRTGRETTTERVTETVRTSSFQKTCKNNCFDVHARTARTAEPLILTAKCPTVVANTVQPTVTYTQPTYTQPTTLTTRPATNYVNYGTSYSMGLSGYTGATTSTCTYQDGSPAPCPSNTSGFSTVRRQNNYTSCTYQDGSAAPCPNQSAYNNVAYNNVAYNNVAYTTGNYARSYVQPTYVQPTQTYVQPTQTYVQPTQTYVQPTQTYVTPQCTATQLQEERTAIAKSIAAHTAWENSAKNSCHCDIKCVAQGDCCLDFNYWCGHEDTAQSLHSHGYEFSFPFPLRQVQQVVAAPTVQYVQQPTTYVQPSYVQPTTYVQPTYVQPTYTNVNRGVSNVTGCYYEDGSAAPCPTNVGANIVG